MKKYVHFTLSGYVNPPSCQESKVSDT